MSTTTAVHSEPAIDPSLQQLKDMDRDSAVALGVILILLVVACAYYIYAHLQAKREADIEKQYVAERRETWCGNPVSDTGLGSRKSIMKMKELGRKTWVHDCGDGKAVYAGNYSGAWDGAVYAGARGESSSCGIEGGWGG
ncbi:hypothetical protein NX059_004938 [Plenodomus lindquistii]|nr:hypothetical protein NX059_004938 [Plenodomus lindquistii]